ncbi:hypothetical protein SO802_024771 [Lithocarpus litseifolius]|uniref:Uncharacterized protein n=1 Tax=Lithocarpus litseifolius TaxID=425828 RepID=A0AAW2CBL1_9ROSI
MWVAKDTEDLNRTMSERSGGRLRSQEERAREDYDGAGSSNDKPYPKRIARLLEIMAHGNSDCEESKYANSESLPTLLTTPPCPHFRNPQAQPHFVSMAGSSK